MGPLKERSNPEGSKRTVLTSCTEDRSVPTFIAPAPPPPPEPAAPLEPTYLINEMRGLLVDSELVESIFLMARLEVVLYSCKIPVAGSMTQFTPLGVACACETQEAPSCTCTIGVYILGSLSLYKKGIISFNRLLSELPVPSPLGSRSHQA